MAYLARVSRLTVALISVAPAHAADPQGPACASRNAVVERLEQRFGEVRQAVGLNRENGLIEFFAAADTGTWTILLTRPDGVSCLIASGDTFENQGLPLRRPEVGV